MKLQKCMVLLYKGMELHSLMHGIAFLRISSIQLFNTKKICDLIINENRDIQKSIILFQLY